MIDEELDFVMMEQTLLGDEVHQFDMIIVISHDNDILFKVPPINLRECNDEAILRVSDSEIEDFSHCIVFMYISCPKWDDNDGFMFINETCDVLV